ncbi:hypothetical protein DRO31_08350 [Candidatus Bathyarchaeota archaeon]|nr:MAG: hypothetical protein DRO31_08350 [Candidatus Bathyarchaeota archaeon]
MNTLTVGANIVNAFTPFLFSYVLYDIYKEKKRRFYLYWCFAFLAYGVSNIINASMRLIGTETPTTVALIGVFAFLAFTGLFVGVGELTNRVRFYCYLSLGIPIITAILYIAGKPITAFSVFFMLPYVILTVVLIILSLKYKTRLNLLILGWILIIVANVGVATGVLDIFSSPVLALIGKVFIFYWMTRPYFSNFADVFDDFIKEPIVEDTVQMERYIMMVETDSSVDTLGWIRRKIIETESGVRSILFIVDSGQKYDTGELEKLDNLYIFRVIEGFQKSGAMFSERVMEVSNDISELTVLIYDLLEYIRVNQMDVQLFFYDVSDIIKRNGWRRIYSQMISLIPQFKESNIRVHIICDQEKLENKYIVEILRHLADNVISLEY